MCLVALFTIHVALAVGGVAFLPQQQLNKGIAVQVSQPLLKNGQHLEWSHSSLPPSFLEYLSHLSSPAHRYLWWEWWKTPLHWWRLWQKPQCISYHRPRPAFQLLPSSLDAGDQGHIYALPTWARFGKVARASWLHLTNSLLAEKTCGWLGQTPTAHRLSYGSRSVLSTCNKNSNIVIQLRSLAYLQIFIKGTKFSVTLNPGRHTLVKQIRMLDYVCAKLHVHERITINK